MKFLPLLFLLILLQSCDAFTDKRAVSAKEFYELKDNVTITKVTEGQILENATPKAQQIYQKIKNKKEQIRAFLETNKTQEELYQLLELDSIELNIVEKIAYYKEVSKIEYEEEKQIFEAYQNITDTTLYQQNLQLLHGKEKILYNYPNFDSKENKFDGIWSIVLSQKAIIRSFKKKK
jgi:4-alpha-glucanotransferase